MWALVFELERQINIITWESYNSRILYISVIFPLGSFTSDMGGVFFLASLHLLPLQSVPNRTIFSIGQKCQFLLQSGFCTMILNNIDDVLFDDCFMLPAASVGRRHVGFPCKSCRLPGLRQLSLSLPWKI